MKITCQACQSKYTIADDKIQGKVAKIRCRKCGATVLVDASTGSQPINGAAVAVSGETWSVSVAEGDQRSMQLQEVIDAYNTGVITVDTYVWKEGMGDWQPLADTPAIVEALNQANAGAETAQAVSMATPDPDPIIASASASPVASRREGTGRNRDLFGRGAGDDEVATSAAPDVLARGGFGASGDPAGQLVGTGLTGARDEHSVLFSLTALTNNNASNNMPGVIGSGAGVGSAKNDDSGLIDLNALAQAQQSRAAAEAASPTMAQPSPFLFPAALGTVEAPAAARDDRKKSHLPVIVGGAIALGAVVLAFALSGGDKNKDDLAPSTSAVPAVAAPTPTPEPVTPPPTAASAEAAPADSAAAAASAKPAAAKKVYAPSARPAARPAAPPAAAAPAAPAPPKPKASPCGCAPGDLQCQIRCSATGH